MFTRACEGHTASTGGLNLVDFRREVIQRYPSHKGTIKAMNRSELNQFCQQMANLQHASSKQILQTSVPQVRSPLPSVLVPQIPNNINAPQNIIERSVNNIYVISFLPSGGVPPEEYVDIIYMVQVRGRDEMDAFKNFVDLANIETDEDDDQNQGESTMDGILIFLIQFIRQGMQYDIRNIGGEYVSTFDEVEQDLRHSGLMGFGIGFDADVAMPFIARHRDHFAYLLYRAWVVGTYYHSIKRVRV